METAVIDTLNTWKQEHIDKACEILNRGGYVHMASSALGHTLANIVESLGICKLRDIYGDALETVKIKGWDYCHLKGGRAL